MRCQVEVDPEQRENHHTFIEETETEAKTGYTKLALAFNKLKQHCLNVL